MPSFDIVSNVDSHEVTNAVDQAQRELTTRFDFKGVKASFSQEDSQIIIQAEAEFQVNQMRDILIGKMIKRGIDAKSLDPQTPEINLSTAKQTCIIKQGIEQPVAKKINAVIKEAKLKVQTSIQGDKVRVIGKKRDDLQSAIQLLKEQEFEVPLQFDNFRD